jgi:hypothetical protein
MQGKFKQRTGVSKLKLKPDCSIFERYSNGRHSLDPRQDITGMEVEGASTV